jgi:hypothetical protein
MAYRVLVVAPETDLVMVSAEVMNVVNALGAKILQHPESNVYGLLNMINEPFDILWFATHGDENGIYLSEGELLSTSELTTVVRAAGARLTVLNTCSSRPVALTIHDELQTEFVCTIKPVPDRTAFITGTIFARKLAQGLGFFEAYQQAKPGQNSTYAYIGDREQVMPTNERSSRTDDELGMIKDSVRRLEALVSGNPQWNVYGLVPEVRDLRSKVEQLIAEVGISRNNQIFNRRLLIFLSIICSGLLVTVVILLTQRGVW